MTRRAVIAGETARAPGQAVDWPDPVALVVFDFDGVMTDNRVLVFSDGTEAVMCHRGDGLGIDRLREAEVPMLILSTETNPVVAARARKLKLLWRTPSVTHRRFFAVTSKSARSTRPTLLETR